MVTGRDDHTHWVMDILPYPIQMFWLIPGSLWVELNPVGYGYYPYPTCIYIYIYINPKLTFTHTHFLSPEPPSSPLLSLFLSPEPPWSNTLNSSLQSPAPPLRWSSPSSNQLSQPRNLSLILGPELSLCTKPWSVFTSKNHDLKEGFSLVC